MLDVVIDVVSVAIMVVVVFVAAVGGCGNDCVLRFGIVFLAVVRAVF